MAEVTDLSSWINRATGGNSGTPETIWWHKTPRVAGVAATAPIAGREASLWTYDGSPSGGVAPGAVAIPDNTTSGGLKQTDPTGGRQRWAGSFGAVGLNGGTLLLYDRLLHISGLNATTTTAQTVGGTLTRYTNGAGNIVWCEIYTIIGTTATTVTMSYTDQDGTAGNTSQATSFGATGFREVTRIIRMPLASGDTGVRAVASVTVLATTGTAGNFGVTVAHPLAVCTPASSGIASWRDLVTGLPGLPEIKTDACLAMAWVPLTTTAPDMLGWLHSQEH